MKKVSLEGLWNAFVLVFFIIIIAGAIADAVLPHDVMQVQFNAKVTINGVTKDVVLYGESTECATLLFLRRNIANQVTIKYPMSTWMHNPGETEVTHVYEFIGGLKEHIETIRL